MTEKEMCKFKVSLLTPKGKSIILVHVCEHLGELYEYITKNYPKCKIETIIGS